MNDKPLLKTPGEMLSEAREARELSLAQLSERTKIPPPVLAALEMDEYHKISGPLYIKSFLRTCAVDLGLDPEEVLGLYKKISGENQAGPGGADTVWKEQDVQVSRIGLPWIRIALVAGLGAILIGFGLFSLRGCGDDEPVEEQSAAVAAPETLAVEVAPVVVEALPDSLAPDGLIIPSWAQAQIQGDTQADAGGSENIEEKVDEVVVEQTPVPASVDPEPVEADTVEEIPATEPDEAATDLPVGSASESEVPAEVIIESSVMPRIDSSWPLVLRIVCDGPGDIQVKRDGDREFAAVIWPAENESAPEVPEAGFQAGRAYGQAGKLVVFWGADDHFSLKIGRVRGIEVAINGRVRDISKLRPGQEIILDAHSAGSSSQR